MVINILDVKEDGVSSYIKAMGINEIEIVKVINKKMIKKGQIILLNMNLINGIKSHLFTCFNMKTIYKKFRENMWLYSILSK